MTHIKWRDDPRGPYIRLHSGYKFHLRNPPPEAFRIPDIAHHSARIRRYTGASEISIAQHEVVAARMAARFYPDEKLLPARLLIHDVAEFAYGDVSSPLKSMLPEYKELEMIADVSVETRFDLTFVGVLLVKEVDDRMFLTEREVVYEHVEDDISEDYSGPLTPFELTDTELGDLFLPWPAEYAEEQWLIELSDRLPWVSW